jgi:hypothetical protein
MGLQCKQKSRSNVLHLSGVISTILENYPINLIITISSEAACPL